MPRRATPPSAVTAGHELPSLPHHQAFLAPVELVGLTEREGQRDEGVGRSALASDWRYARMKSVTRL